MSSAYPLDTLTVEGVVYRWLDLERVVPAARLRRLPYCLRVLLENVARCEPEAIPPLLAHLLEGAPACEVPFRPNRLMLHDTTCLPALADLAGLRDAIVEHGGDAVALNPRIPVVLTIDHSVIVEHHGSAESVAANLDIDFRRNDERYRFIRWAERNVDNFKVVPPGTGIIHQVNMEALAEVVCVGSTSAGAPLLHPDAMVATDSHTPMVNALGVVAWGVGGLEGQAAMLGEPVSIPCPRVVGVRVANRLRSGVTATDVALHLTELLRRHGVVGAFVEFCGPGLAGIDSGMRGTLANMAPEYGATVVHFPFDAVTLDYLRLTGRSADHCARVEAYMKAQGLWRNDDPIDYAECLELDLGTIEPCAAGPYLPQQRRPLREVPGSFRREVVARHAGDADAAFRFDGEPGPLRHGALVLAAITSCTNTANPRLMLQAGLLARNAHRLGLRVPPWVKTSLSPGSRVVADYLSDAGLMAPLAALGFEVVGFGCMTCIGNSGPLEARVDALVNAGLLGAGVLSGNRNFEGRVHPKLAGAYLASPPLVVAWALAGAVTIDLEREPIGRGSDGRSIFLRDVWPDDDEVETMLRRHLRPGFFVERNRTLWAGTPHWKAIGGEQGVRFPWRERSTYLRRPAYTVSIPRDEPATRSLHGARALLWLGDDVTTDHISPVGSIPAESEAGRWLLERGEKRADLNQYSTRRSNHEVMVRGAFTTRNLRNRLLAADQPLDGAHARALDGAVRPVREAAETYVRAGVPLLVFAGSRYGAGSSRDWAAKAAALLGVRAVIARSFERIHRSNLIGMGVLPLEFEPGESADDLQLEGDERFDLLGLESIGIGRMKVTLVTDGSKTRPARCKALGMRIESRQELAYLRHGGILPYVLRRTLASSIATRMPS